MKRVSFQGEPGAYSEDAAVSFFDDKIKTIPCPTFAKVLKNTEDNECDYDDEYDYYNDDYNDYYNDENDDLNNVDDMLMISMISMICS